MAERVIINYSVKATTKARIGRLGELTNRGMGNVVDYAIDRLWEEYHKQNPQGIEVQQPAETIAELTN